MIGMSEDIKPQYNTGDLMTISRGKQRGQEGKVIAVDTDKQEYAVSTADGLKVVSFAAVKAKQEPTVTESRLNQALLDFGMSPEIVDQFMSTLFGNAA
jgi:hypothetical protein